MAAAWIPLIVELEPEVQALVIALIKKIHGAKPAAAKAAIQAAHASLASSSLDGSPNDTTP